MSRRPTARSSHSTEWRWNLGGPASSGQSSARPRQESPGSASTRGNDTSSRWRWNLGGAWQPPSPPPPPPQGSGQALNGPPQAHGDRHSQALARESLGSREGGGSQRPWQRRRMQAEASHDQLVAEEEQEASRADSSFSQGWRRLVPRFLRRGDFGQPGQDSEGTAASQNVPSGHQGGAFCPRIKQLTLCLMTVATVVLTVIHKKSVNVRFSAKYVALIMACKLYYGV